MIDIEKSSHNVMDVTVYALTMQEVLQWVKEGMGDEKPRLIATANAEMIMQAQEDKELGRILNRADLVVPDGAGVLWAGETLGTPFPERVTGADLSVELLKIASKEGWPVYFWAVRPASRRRRPIVSKSPMGRSDSWAAMTATSTKKKRNGSSKTSGKAELSCSW